ncbi:MAG TPA: hypothetical protein VJS68_00925 [Thermoplasmata archaeon]|nr:hypothetical protein [Thermoplasmata archaeon]
MRHRKRGRRRLLCPHCGSERIQPDVAGILGQVYRCPDCDYRGSLVLETDEPRGPA